MRKAEFCPNMEQCIAFLTWDRMKPLEIQKRQTNKKICLPNRGMNIKNITEHFPSLWAFSDYQNIPSILKITIIMWPTSSKNNFNIETEGCIHDTISRYYSFTINEYKSRLYILQLRLYMKKRKKHELRENCIYLYMRNRVWEVTIDDTYMHHFSRKKSQFSDIQPWHWSQRCKNYFFI